MENVAKMLNFITVTDENHAEFHRLMQMYANELDKHQERRTDPEMLRKWTKELLKINMRLRDACGSAL